LKIFLVLVLLGLLLLDKNIMMTLIFATGAQDLAVFLTEELKLEKQSACSQLPKLHGFQLITTSGPSVMLMRKYYNEMYEHLRFASFLSLLLLLNVD